MNDCWRYDPFAEPEVGRCNVRKKYVTDNSSDSLIIYRCSRIVLKHETEGNKLGISLHVNMKQTQPG